jgi:hypothetical protein
MPLHDPLGTAGGHDGTPTASDQDLRRAGEVRRLDQQVDVDAGLDVAMPSINRFDGARCAKRQEKRPKVGASLTIPKPSSFNLLWLGKISRGKPNVSNISQHGYCRTHNVFRRSQL